MGIKIMDENQPNVMPQVIPPRMVTQGRMPSAPPANPLSKHFRQAAIYIKFPSNGRYWEPGSLEMPENDEVPVFPMTSKDEITLRTPDALINGQGVVDVIHSCIPAVKNAWKMPSVDVDTALISMRIASYGHMMDFESSCPKCGEEHTYGLDLRNMLAAIKCPDYETLMDLQSIQIKFRPQSYFQTTQINQANFELQRYEKLINELGDNDDTLDERSKLITQQVKRLTELSIEVLVNATDYIIDVETQSKIDRRDFIKEFYSNIDSRVINEINDWLGELVKESNAKPQKVNCGSCGEEIELTLLFDYANFFVVGF